MTNEKILSVQDVGKKLKTTEQNVRLLIRDKKMEATRVGKQWAVPESCLMKYIKDYDIVVDPDDHPRISDELPEIVALSFFSGAMGLDIGMEKAGIHALLACELDKSCRKTISYNRPNMALIGDINNYEADEIRRMAKIPEDREIDVMFGGPPCQAFSTAGNRKGFDDERGNVFLRYLDLANHLRPKILVIENVRGLMSTPYFVDPTDYNSKIIKGAALMYIIKKIREMGYSISFNLYNAANFGAPQSRERFVIICQKNGQKAPYLKPTHSQNGEYGLPPWKTLKDALKGLDTKNMHFIEFPEKRLKYYRMLKEGQCWRDLPKELQREAMGNSYDLPGGKTGFYRRLSYSSPSPTLVTDPTMPATDLCHPTELRPLSVEEYKRIQEFPDDWKVYGNVKNQYKQIGNAVPISLGYAVGKSIIALLNGETPILPYEFNYSRYKNTNDEDFVKYMEKCVHNEKIKSKSEVLVKTRISKEQKTFDNCLN